GETTSDSFDFSYTDGIFTYSGNTFAITVTPVNDAPAGADNAVTILEDATYSFDASDFGFSDIDLPAQSLQAVRIASLPVLGTLFLAAGASAPGPVSNGQYVSVADLAFLRYTP